jgi:hypothetical protein
MCGAFDMMEFDDEESKGESEGADDEPEPVCQSHFPAKEALPTRVTPKAAPKPRATVTFAFIRDSSEDRRAPTRIPL